MKTYQELKDNFFEEVGKVDVSKLTLSTFSYSLTNYAELLKIMAEIPDKSYSERYGACCCQGFEGTEIPKIEEGGK